MLEVVNLRRLLAAIPIFFLSSYSFLPSNASDFFLLGVAGRISECCYARDFLLDATSLFTMKSTVSPIAVPFWISVRLSIKLVRYQAFFSALCLYDQCIYHLPIGSSWFSYMEDNCGHLMIVQRTITPKWCVQLSKSGTHDYPKVTLSTWRQNLMFTKNFHKSIYKNSIAHNFRTLA